MFSAEQRRTISDAVQQILNALFEPDPRGTPDEHLREMMDRSLGNLSQRIQKAEAIIVDYNRRLNEMEEFLTPVMEDNLIAHHSDMLNNLHTAIRQLGNAEVKKTIGDA